MDEIKTIYDRLKTKYPLTLTTTLALNSGYTVDVPVIRGIAKDCQFDLYLCENQLVFSVEIFGKTGTDRYTHRHPLDAEDAICMIEQRLSEPGIVDRNELYLSLTDTEWPFTYTSHDRMIVRAIVVDDDGYFYFVRAERDDDFGRATIIETSGGGVEAGEDLQEAIRRELREELGAEVEILCRLGVVSDYYNLIHRHNINNYFLCRVLSFGERHLMPDEIEQFHLSTLKVSYADAIAEYERCAKTPLGRLVANREMLILKHAKVLFDDLSASAVFDDIRTHLPPDEQERANAFVRFLLANNLHFRRDTSPCWRDKRYYWVMDGTECVCFIAIADPDEPQNRFTVWSDDMGNDALNTTVDDRVRILAWQHVDHCGRCGSCGGGRHKVIFGRTFDDVCGCTFRVDNPNADDLLFLKELVRIRITEIQNHHR